VSSVDPLLSSYFPSLQQEKQGRRGPKIEERERERTENRRERES